MKLEVVGRQLADSQNRLVPHWPQNPRSAHSELRNHVIAESSEKIAGPSQCTPMKGPLHHFRHMRQWQMLNEGAGTGTSNWTAPQRQPPLRIDVDAMRHAPFGLAEPEGAGLRVGLVIPRPERSMEWLWADRGFDANHASVRL